MNATIHAADARKRVWSLALLACAALGCQDRAKDASTQRQDSPEPALQTLAQAPQSTPQRTPTHATQPAPGGAHEPAPKREGAVWLGSHGQWSLWGHEAPTPPDSDATAQLTVRWLHQGQELPWPGDTRRYAEARFVPPSTTSQAPAALARTLEGALELHRPGQPPKTLEALVGTSIAVSVDGCCLAYMVGEEPSGLLRVLRLETGQQMTLDRGDRPTWSPAISPHGERLAWVESDEQGRPWLLTQPLDWRPEAPQALATPERVSIAWPVEDNLPVIPVGPDPPVWRGDTLIFPSQRGVVAVTLTGQVRAHWPHVSALRYDAPRDQLTDESGLPLTLP